MTMIEWMLVIVFVIPILILCSAFVVLAAALQKQEGGQA